MFIAAGMINENWLKVAFTAMALGIGLYLIPLGLIANPEILQLGQSPFAALIAFIQLGIGLSAVSFGLIGYSKPLIKLIAIATGLAIIFARLVM